MIGWLLKIFDRETYDKLFKDSNKSNNGFKIEVVTSWFSDKYVEFRYTTNGWTWNYIYRAHKPFLGLLDYNWTWEKVSYRLGNGNFDAELSNWDSVEKINAYHKSQKERYEKGYADILRQRLEYRQERAAALNRANKKNG